jgi:uncharacterized protein (TIGR00252 family)
MSNYSHGHDAEKKAAEYLQDKGYKILDINWKTKVCEIDLIAEKSRIIYFVEVKYRQSAQQGHGLDYITPAKQKQMEFAARVWTSEYNFTNDYRLAAIEIIGPEFQVEQFIEL